MSFLKNLFGGKRSEFDNLSTSQRALLERAQSTVQNYLANGKMFPLFAMVVQRDGQIESYLPAEPSGPPQAAIVGLIKALLPLARQGAVTATVLVTPMDPPGGSDLWSAMFDLEQRGERRMAARLPFRRGSAGVEYGDMTFRPMEPKMFPVQQ